MRTINLREEACSFRNRFSTVYRCALQPPLYTLHILMEVLFPQTNIVITAYIVRHLAEKMLHAAVPAEEAGAALLLRRGAPGEPEHVSGQRGRDRVAKDVPETSSRLPFQKSQYPRLRWQSCPRRGGFIRLASRHCNGRRVYRKRLSRMVGTRVCRCSRSWRRSRK